MTCDTAAVRAGKPHGGSVERTDAKGLQVRLVMPGVVRRRPIARDPFGRHAIEDGASRRDKQVFAIAAEADVREHSDCQYPARSHGCGAVSKFRAAILRRMGPRW